MKVFQVGMYARVSSDQQVEAGTIESQVAALHERIEQDGALLTEELSFIDPGYSGASLIRPALERLRDRVALHGLDRLYVLSPDRLARKYAYQVLLLEEFQRNGVEVVFLNRGVGQSPEDQLLLQMQGMISEYERAKILERSRRGKRYAAQSGDVAVLSGAPYGYRYLNKQDGGGQARYEVILEEADVVRKIFGWVGVERASIGEVCRRLKQAKILSPRGKPAWDRTTVWGLLKNPAYKGTAAFGKTRSGPLHPRLRPQRGQQMQPRRPVSITDCPVEGWMLIPVPALVDEELFEAVEKQLQENRKRARQSQRGARYLLQGLLVCAHCGYAFYGKPVSRKSAKGKEREYAYYRCIGTDAFRFAGERICDNLQVRTDRLDQAVWDEVCDLLRDRQRLQQEYERRLNAPRKENGNRVTLRAQIAKVEHAIARLIDGYAEGFIQKQEFEPRITRLRQRLVELEEQAQRIAEEETSLVELQRVIGRLEEFAEKVKDHLAEADWSMRRELIRTLVKRVEVGKEEVKVIFRTPPDSVSPEPDVKSLQLCRGSSHTSLRRPGVRGLIFPHFHDPSLEHLTDEVDEALISDAFT
jgi:site-specific DNA recombinase